MELVKGKAGVDLYRELLRVYPVAELEDYYKAGIWKNDVMLTDYLLIGAHRREGGAPEPLPLEEIPIPRLPKVVAAPLSAPIVMRATPKAAATQTPIKPVRTASGAPGSADRLTALFVAKHNLVLSRAKSLLMGLEPPHRRAVLVSFRAPAAARDATAELEKYIEECEASGDWGDPRPSRGPAGAGRPAAEGAGAAAPAKRPAAPAGDPEASKRPRLGDAAAGPAPGAGRAAARVVPPRQKGGGSGIVARLAGWA